MLHSFNYTSGNEEWSFVPPSLLNKFETTLSARNITNANESNNFSASLTSITVLDASEFPASGVVRIDDEYIRYTTKSNTVLSGLTRGYDSSTAATHLKDSVVIDVTSKQSVTSSMYGVDGSPVVKDIYTLDDGCGVPTWKTIAMIPLGRGGYSYTALDITDVDKPLHLFTIENDKTSDLSKTNLWHTVYTRSNCLITSSRTYKKTTTYQTPNNLTELVGNITAAATSLTVADASIFTSEGCPQKCMVTIDGEIITYNAISGNTLTGLSRQAEANDDNPNSMNASHADGASVRQQKSCGEDNVTDFNAVKETIRYDYSALGQAWGRPDIYLLDTENEGKRWISILGAGYNGGSDCHVGSAVYLLYLENFTSDSNGEYYNGSIAKKINIPGGSMDLPNSIPGDLTVITNDSSTAFDMEPGALVYFADINNRVWKVDLSKSASQNNVFGQKKLLFEDESNFVKQNRNFQRVLATMDESLKYNNNDVDGVLRLYYGTGNVQNIGEANLDIQNSIYGLSDPEFPYFGNTGTIQTYSSIDNTAVPAYDITKCFEGTNISFSAGLKPQYGCPELSLGNPGWKFDLAQGERVVGEKALLTGGYVYFSIYEPDILNSCQPGRASMGVYNYMCPAGSAVQIKLGKGLLTAAESDGEYIYFGQSNVSDVDNERGQVKTGTAKGDMATAVGGTTKGAQLGASVQSIDEEQTGELSKMGLVESSKSKSMDRSWRELN